jgi:hypothetical protein
MQTKTMLVIDFTISQRFSIGCIDEWYSLDDYSTTLVDIISQSKNYRWVLGDNKWTLIAG